ncbi:hypothetical protein [Nereida sp. MMG025]|uniref:hypothetical protein n=1 Tax=Nereida sp. MMG025 TaxID=2909981 RepID=UPI001F17A676|nr:hypothetical protein [Nereida sp. MMG025]MCF6444963.1 hypothetical protein [Nereida sp. MMG025]
MTRPTPVHERLTTLLGYGLVALILIWMVLRYTTLASGIPYPKSMRIVGLQDPFLQCFTQHSFLAQTDGVTFNRGFVAQPRGGFKMTQSRGMVRLVEARALFVVDTQGGELKVIDAFYRTKQPNKLRPIRKLDWLIVRMCADGTL